MEGRLALFQYAGLRQGQHAVHARGVLGRALGIHLCKRKGRRKQDWSERKVGV